MYQQALTGAVRDVAGWQRGRTRQPLLGNSGLREGRPARSLDTGCETHRRSFATRSKRVFDVLAAVALLLILLIPMLVIALLIRITSRGPVFYLQDRSGIGGTRFLIFKFRSMVTDAEMEIGPVWPTDGDPRQTAVGKILRRFHLDELPQILNVIRGDMSLIGPRPERPHFVHRFASELPAYMDRFHVLPGLTGWAQVNGWNGNTCIKTRLRHDLEYVRHWSLTFDVYILLRTPLQVLRGNRAS